ncbi:MAG: hypothetical protein KatS3mg129_2168 [Leptospiraceae bacterium]|nr:MAG: hypothetical protein KatS3mg129_2168 [Leptospiraceae bacterium]
MRKYYLFILFIFIIFNCKTFNINQIHQWIYQCPDQDPEVAYLFDRVTPIKIAKDEKQLPSGPLKTIGVSNYFDEFYQYLLSDLGKNQIPYTEKNDVIETQDFLIRKIKNQNNETIAIQVVAKSESIFNKNNVQLSDVHKKAIASLSRALKQFNDAGLEIYKYFDNPSNKSEDLQKAFAMQLLLNKQYNIPSERILNVDTKDYNQNKENSQIALLQYPQKLEILILPEEKTKPQLEEPLSIGTLAKLGDEEYLQKMYNDLKEQIKQDGIEFKEDKDSLTTKDIVIKKIKSQNNRLIAILIYIRTEPIFSGFFSSKEELNDYGEKLLNIAGKTIKVFQESNLYFYGRTFDFEQKEKLKTKTNNTKIYLQKNQNISEDRFLIVKTIVSNMKDNPFGPKTEILHFYLFTLPASYLVDYLPEEIREIKKGLAHKMGTDTYLDLMFSQLVEDLKERGINITRKDSLIEQLVDRYEATGFYMGKIQQKKKTKIIKISFDGDFSFDLGSAKLTEKAKKVIEAMAKALKEYPDAKARIHGHTDSTGSKDFNYKLSQDRAEAVKNELVNVHHIDPKRFIEVKGFADDRKIEDTMGPSAKNRRVEILIEVPDQEVAE